MFKSSYVNISRKLPTENNSIEALQTNAYIAGVCVASVEKDGSISSTSYGFTSGCGLLKMNADPSLLPFQKLDLKEHDALILFNENFFYADQKNKKVTKIDLSNVNENEIDYLKSQCSSSYKLADQSEWEVIAKFAGISAPERVTANTIFGAASLTKPVLAYLVLKLAASGKYRVSDQLFTLGTKLNHILPFTVFCQKHQFKFPEAMNNDDRFNLITSRTILSHSSGLDYFNQGEWPVVFYANPGDEYIYSGIGIYYLQEVIETLTQKPLEALAREYLFGPEGIMKRSTFYPEYQLALASEKEKEYQQPGTLYIKLTDEGLEYEIKRQALITGMVPWAKLPSDFPKQASEIIKNQSKYVSMILDHTASIGATEPAIAANSLRTTAEDYANFLKVWLTDPDLKIAFNPEIYMTHDKWAIDAGVRQEDLEQVAWGLGWGLQTTQQNEAEFIYHSGDMDNWRAWAVINLKAKTAIVYFANSSNGHVLAESIVAPEGKLEPVFNYFYQKYGFSRNIEELQAEGERMSSMGSYLTGSRGKKMTEEVSGKPSTFLPQVEERMRSTVCPRND